MQRSNPTPNVHFLTFGAGPDFQHSLSKIKTEAHTIPLFNHVHAWGEQKLTKDESFWGNHGEFISRNKRGWGYWIWKPYVVLQVLENINEDDIIVYADCGCQLNNTPNALNRLAEYIEIARTSPHGILSFVGKHPDLVESRFTKMDTALAMHSASDNFLDTKQLIATTFVVRKCVASMNLFRSYYDTCCANKYHLINDAPSVVENRPNFIEHRHDQSIFSLLRKKTGTDTIIDETYWAPDWEKRGSDFPIWARRRKLA